MSGLEHTLWWSLLVLGLAGTAVYSGLETGMYFLNRVRLEVRAAHGPSRWAARLLQREIARPERVLASNLIATIVCGDLAATSATRLLAAWGYSEGAIVAINAAVLTPVFFVLVETIPKELFRLETDRLTYPLAGVVGGTRRFLTVTGALSLVRLVTRAVSRALGGAPDAGLAPSARDRVATMLKDTAATGVLSESQAGLVDRAMLFQRTTVGDEMVLWERVRAIPADWTREQAARLLARERHTYWPVVERRQASGGGGGGGGGVRVVGVLRYQDLFVRPGAPILAMSLPPARLPPRMTLADALRKVREAAVPVGVVEEDGRPVGFVTVTDLIEPLTGVLG